MYVPCGKTFAVVQRSRSYLEVKVKYQDDICKERKAVIGA